jgi:hypothetical protein
MHCVSFSTCSIFSVDMVSSCGFGKAGMNTSFIG